MKIKLFVSAFILYSSFVPGQADSSKPFVLGTIEQIQSVQLGEKRTLNIYLPEGYNKDDTTRYPVIYLLDGSADEDFIHVVGLVQFCSFPWVNRIQPSIVVGIANVDRKRDFTYPSRIEDDKKLCPTSGHSDKFIAFIEKELHPFIEKKYKTNNSKTIIGESLGGLLVTEILFKDPSLFNKYIIVSPSLWWDNGSMLKADSSTIQEDLKLHLNIYIGVGKEGLGPSKSPHISEDDAKMLAERLKRFQNTFLSIYFDYLPDENHATISHQASLLQCF